VSMRGKGHSLNRTKPLGETVKNLSSGSWTGDLKSYLDWAKDDGIQPQASSSNRL